MPQDAQAQAELTRQIVNTVPEGLMLLALALKLTGLWVSMALVL